MSRMRHIEAEETLRAVLLGAFLGLVSGVALAALAFGWRP